MPQGPHTGSVPGPAHPPRVSLLGPCAAAEARWRAIERQAPPPSPFQCYDWLSAWQAITATPRGVEPVVVGVDSPDGAPWMVLPLCRQRSGGAWVLTWMGGGVSGYHGPLVAPACPPDLLGSSFLALWDRVLGVLPRCDLLHLDRQPPTLGAMDNPFRRLGPTVSQHGSPRLHLSGDWEAEYSRKVSSKGRGKDRRKQRRLEDHGELRFEIAADPAHADEIIDVLVAWKSRWFAEQGVADMFAVPHNVALLHELARSHPELVHVSCVRVGAEIQAAHWGIVRDGTFCYWFQSQAENELTRYSASDLLVRLLLEWCCEHGVHTFDFGIGDHPYKLRWADEQVPLHECLVPLSPWGRALVAGRRAQADLRRRIKASERLYPLALDLRARLHRLRQGGSG